MCRTIAEGGRRCGCAYNMRLNFNTISDVIASAQAYRKSPSSGNARKQPIRRLANYQRKLQAEAYNIDHALDALTANVIGRDLIEGEVVVMGEDNKPVTLSIKRPAPRFDGTGVEKELSEEELIKVSSKNLSMSALKEKHPDVYDAIHLVNGKDSRDYLPEAFEEGSFEKRHSRYKNNYTKNVNGDSSRIIDDIVSLTTRAKQTRALRSEIKKTLADSLPVGTKLAPWKQGDEFTSSGIEIVETHDSVTAAKVRAWAKSTPEEGGKVLEDITYVGLDSAKIKRHLPHIYEKHRVQGSDKLEVK